MTTTTNTTTNNKTSYVEVIFNIIYIAGFLTMLTFTAISIYNSY